MYRIFDQLSEDAKTNLRGNLHKVAAVIAKQEGHQILSDEITLKEAAFLMGSKMWRHYLEKRAMLDGIMHLHMLKNK